MRRDPTLTKSSLVALLVAGAVVCAMGVVLASSPFSAAAQSYERHIERARDYYLEVEFDRAIDELRAALADRSITQGARRDALMMLGTIQTAQGDLSAAARTFAEVRVRWPEFEPPRNVPPSARQVFAAVPQDEMDRVERELGSRSTARERRRDIVSVPDENGTRRRRDRREEQDDGGGGGIPAAVWIGGGAVILAAVLVVTVLVVTADDRATVTIRFGD